MIKIFFVTFFISELIIAFAVIIKIYEFDKCVNEWNRNILSNRNVIRLGLIDLRHFLQKFNKKFLELQELFKQKKQEYLFKALKTSIVYTSVFFLKGKYKKSVLAYQIIKEVYEGFKEAS